MVCGACKSDVKEGARFCTVCGAAMDKTINAEQTVADLRTTVTADSFVPFSQPEDNLDATVAAPIIPKEAAPVKEKEPKKKMSAGKKAMIIICCVLVVLVGAAIAAVVSVFNSPAKQVADLLEDKKFSKAVSLYESEIEDNFIQEKLLAKFISGYSDEIYNGFIAKGVPADEAIEALEAVKEMNVYEIGEISVKIENVNNLQASRDAYENAVELYEKGDYINAGEEFKKVIETDEDYSKAQQKVGECNEKYKEYILNQVGTPVTDSDYESAIAVLENAATSTGDGEINEKLNTVKSKYAKTLKERAFSESVVLLEQKKYAEAFEIINKAALYNEGDTEIASLISSVTVEYETYVIATADAHLEKYEYDSALEVVDGGLAVLTQSSALINKKAAIEAAIPVSLSKELMINSDGWFWNEGVPVDPFNNDYSSSSNYVIISTYERHSETSYGEFRVYNKYNKLSGKITPHKGISETDTCYIQIYADDTLLYTSPEVGRKTDTIVLDLDIKNADYIKIIVHKPYYARDGVLILSDLMLHS